LATRAVQVREVRKNIDEYEMKDGRKLYLLAEGRLVNLAAGDGHPAEVMDLTFALQALSLRHIVQKGKSLEAKVHSVPAELDNYVANLRLETLGIKIDHLTKEQEDYLNCCGFPNPLMVNPLSPPQKSRKRPVSTRRNGTGCSSSLLLIRNSYF
jgi:adenosylhomocysteinase